MLGLFAQTMNASVASSRQQGLADQPCRRRNTRSDSKAPTVGNKAKSDTHQPQEKRLSFD